MPPAMNHPFRIKLDIWLARIGSIHAWFWLVLWAMVGVTGLADYFSGVKDTAFDLTLSLLCLGLAVLHVLMVKSCRKTKKLVKDFRVYGPALARVPDKSVPELAKVLNTPAEQVTAQIQEMCKRGYFNGYLDHQAKKLVFLRSSSSI